MKKLFIKTKKIIILFVIFQSSSCLFANESEVEPFEVTCIEEAFVEENTSEEKESIEVIEVGEEKEKSYEKLYERGKEAVGKLFQEYIQVKQKLSELESELSETSCQGPEFNDLIKKIELIISSVQCLELENKIKNEECLRIKKSAGKSLTRVLVVSGIVTTVAVGGLVVRLLIDNYKRGSS